MRINFNIKVYTEDFAATTTLHSGLVTIEGMISTSRQVERHPGQLLLESKIEGAFRKVMLMPADIRCVE